LAPAERQQAYLAMVETLARLHALAPEALGLADFGRAGNYMARQVDRWTRQYRASTDRSLPAMERLIAWLPQTIPAQTRTSIVHGDYKLDNVMFAKTEPRLAAILDWELSTIGDPLCDFTYMLLNWVSGLIADLPDPGAAHLPSRDELVSAYCQLTGREALPDLDWFFSYNLFRLAAIIEGVVGRAREGTARDPQAAALADRPPLLAEAAWRMAQRSGA
jgi:aminoglycoside phosphotransferase (APT) family kinase protein